MVYFWYNRYNYFCINCPKCLVISVIEKSSDEYSKWENKR